MSVRLKLPTGGRFRIADGRFLLIAGLGVSLSPDLARAVLLMPPARARLPRPDRAALIATWAARLPAPPRAVLQPHVPPEIR